MTPTELREIASGAVMDLYDTDTRWDYPRVMRDAADEIESLQSEITRLQNEVSDLHGYAALVKKQLKPLVFWSKDD